MKRTNITIRYRIRTKQNNYQLLNDIYGANRFLWNCALYHLEEDYKSKGTCEYSNFSLRNWYTQLKKEVHWLNEYPPAITKPILKDLSIAYTQFIQGRRGFPKYKKKGKNKPSFPIEIQKHHNRFKPEGFLIKRGHHVELMKYEQQLKRYSNPIPKTARITQSNIGKWYLHVVYEVDAIEVKEDKIGIGIDRNVGQVTDNHGNFYWLTDTSSLNEQIQRLQKHRARKVKGSNRYKKISYTIAKKYLKIKNIRSNDLRHIAKQITSLSTTVVLEYLKTKGMTTSASGTVEHPGKNVKQKSRLNGAILGSGWYQLERYLSQRAVVTKVPSQYTSQKCSCCGYTEKSNRLSQSRFVCVQCGYQENADVNAAKNILACGISSNQKTDCRVFVSPIIHSGVGQNTVKRQKDTIRN